MEELVELNGDEQPYIGIKKDNTIGLYIGKISNKEIKDVYDVIAELNVLSNLYGFEDTRIEYIPYGEDGKDGEDSYRLQQVYNGVMVLSTGISVSVDEDNCIHSILGKYNADVKYANIDTENIITKEESERIIKQYFADTLNIENFTVKSNRLIIHDSACKLIYYSQISANHSVYNIMIDAITGNIDSCSELENNFSNTDNNLSIYYWYKDTNFIIGREIKSIIDYSPNKCELSCGYIHKIYDVKINEENYKKFTNLEYSAEEDESQFKSDLETVYNT